MVLMIVLKPIVMSYAILVVLKNVQPANLMQKKIVTMIVFAKVVL